MLSVPSSSSEITIRSPLFRFLSTFDAQLTTNQPKKTVILRALFRWDRDIEFEPTDDGARVRYATLFPSDQASTRTLDFVQELKDDERLNQVHAKPFSSVRSVTFGIEDPRLATSIAGSSPARIHPTTFSGATRRRCATCGGVNVRGGVCAEVIVTRPPAGPGRRGWRNRGATTY